MIAVIVLLSIGVGLLGVGFFYHLLDDILIDFFSKYVYDTNDVYYVGSAFLWDMWPFVFILMAIVCFILAGLRYRSTNVSTGGIG